MIEIGEPLSFYEQKRMRMVLEKEGMLSCADRRGLPTICVSDLRAAVEYLLALTEPDERRFVWLPTKDGMVAVHRCEFLFAEKEGSFLTVVMDHKTIREVRLSLAGLADLFDGADVVRCHKGFAVNLRRVREIRYVQRRLWEFSFDCETEEACYLGNTYYDEVVAHLQRLSAGASFENLVDYLRTETTEEDA